MSDLDLEKFTEKNEKLLASIIKKLSELDFRNYTTLIIKKRVDFMVDFVKKPPLKNVRN